MSVRFWALNFPLYEFIEPTPLIALLMVMGELAPFRTFILLGGVPWQLPQLLAA